MELVDTHCHLHFKQYARPDQVLEDALGAGVRRFICVGTSLDDSEKAADFAADHKEVWASAGVHPHDAGSFLKDPNGASRLEELLSRPKEVAVGEVGLDYYRMYSPKEKQQHALRMQIEIGLRLGLPFIFHVRDAWEDFWQVFDSYSNLKGVIHSFSAHREQLDKILQRGLYVGLNGIMTFTEDQNQLVAAKAVPLDRLLLETDAPFLTPKPFRGNLCEPKHMVAVAEFLAELRGESLEDLAAASTKNAAKLFDLS